ncbi:short-chain fatty acyl-CoA regulator family protein [Mangrovicoccus sp. HB161399]|uniref:helix-turn-helix domain-containing protein n=1 Tax=Mangrovicoccus sp. HB161399 TaxID=2720392 RepID=UPI0015543F89|nr:helix-turn-helix transcriptional regulator [Mangrovicoccus sp. HB161399]
MEGRKLFAGARLRNLRQAEKLTQRQFAERLGISTSYVNQLENNQRPLSAGVILALVDGFGVDIASFASDDGDRVVNDLHEALSDPIFADRRPSRQELKIAISNTPDFAHAFLTLQRAYQAAKDRMASLDDALQQEHIDAAPLPYEEVRDFFNYANNYIDWLDRGAEALAEEIGVDGGNHLKLGAERLRRVHGMAVVFERGTMSPDVFRIFDPENKRLVVNADAPRATQSFQIWQQIALAEEKDAIERILDDARFRTGEARAIARIGLANFFAGSAMLPYGAFLSAARELRHDIELLADRFGASLEQVAHRLSTLQRPGSRGVPFFFLRVDRAGTITKRHSATRLQFARFGGACPLWGVHQAFERPEETVRQLAETPDGERYICIARTITKRGVGFRAPIRRYAIALGCSVNHAPDMVYADGLNIDQAGDYDLIGSSCRICERTNCPQRSVPPIHAQISVDARVRRVVPFEIS